MSPTRPVLLPLWLVSVLLFIALAFPPAVGIGFYAQADLVDQIKDEGCMSRADGREDLRGLLLVSRRQIDGTNPNAAATVTFIDNLLDGLPTIDC